MPKTASSGSFYRASNLSNANSYNLAPSEVVELSGWGRYPRSRSKVVIPTDAGEIAKHFTGNLIARGQGRSYGTAATLDGGTVMLTERLNRVISLDADTGLLRAEAGLTLSEIIDEFLPQGWFPMVTPGTKFVSLGGCVAADIHGKNHHRDGSFGAHVKELELVLSSGETVRCSQSDSTELFRATLGGMGLTGVITEVAVYMRKVESAFLSVTHNSARNLHHLMDVFEDDRCDDHYTVAWIDCVSRGELMGRGVYMAGHHSTAEEVKRDRKVPLELKRPSGYTARFGLPGWLLGRLPARAFNELYFRFQGRKTEAFLTNYDSFFYPLDRISNWNQLYGKRGFLQYQCVIPAESAREGLQHVLSEVVRSGHASLLGVLKRFGRAGCGYLSFPFEGYTLAVDFPVRDASLFSLLERLDEINIAHGGRVYLAKEARVSRDHFRKMYPGLPEWLAVKSRVDPDNRFTSDLARRIGLA